MKSKRLMQSMILAMSMSIVAMAANGAGGRDKTIAIRNISTNAIISFLSTGLIKVEGEVVSQSSTESIRYLPHIAIEFVEKDTGKPVSADSTFDKEDNVVTPRKTNLFLGITNPSRKLSGKGIVSVYATAPGASGFGNRISNVVRIEVDIDNKTARLLEDIP